jgi:pathogenesis-related protein 1
MLGSMRTSLGLLVLLAACPAPAKTPVKNAESAPAPAPAPPPPPPMALAMAEERALDWVDKSAGDEPPPPPIVIAHNLVRAEHCAPPLTWSEELAAEATAWANQLAANGCAFQHSRSEHGENLAAGTSGALDADAVVAMWAREEEKYDYKRAMFSMKTGHFTQVVWKDTLAIGCGVATCGGKDTWVCNYDSPGNVEGDFALNVAPRGCK